MGQYKFFVHKSNILFHVIYSYINDHISFIVINESSFDTIERDLAIFAIGNTSYRVQGILVN